MKSLEFGRQQLPGSRVRCVGGLGESGVAVGVGGCVPRVGCHLCGVVFLMNMMVAVPVGGLWVLENVMAVLFVELPVGGRWVLVNIVVAVVGGMEVRAGLGDSAHSGIPTSRSILGVYTRILRRAPRITGRR